MEAEETSLNDKTILINLLTARNISFKLKEGEEFATGRSDSTLWLCSNSTGVEGHNDFITIFHFNSEGNLMKVGIWE